MIHRFDVLSVNRLSQAPEVSFTDPVLFEDSSDIFRYVVGECTVVENDVCVLHRSEFPVHVIIPYASGSISSLLMVSARQTTSFLPPRTQQSTRGMGTGAVSMPLLTAFQRLVDPLDVPYDIPILSLIIQREIFYLILVSDQGARLRQIASTGTQSHQIARAIDWLKSNYSQQFHINELASHVNMRASTFHHHFRVLTAMSPLQYQKWLRLNEALRLMLIKPAPHFRSATKALPGPNRESEKVLSFSSSCFWRISACRVLVQNRALNLEPCAVL